MFVIRWDQSGEWIYLICYNNENGAIDDSTNYLSNAQKYSFSNAIMSLCKMSYLRGACGLISMPFELVKIKEVTQPVFEIVNDWQV